jgi:hypothetical protein
MEEIERENNYLIKLNVSVKKIIFPTLKCIPVINKAASPLREA